MFFYYFYLIIKKNKLLTHNKNRYEEEIPLDPIIGIVSINSAC